MTGHHPFIELIKDFDNTRRKRIEKKLHELKEQEARKTILEFFRNLLKTINKR